MKKTKKNSLNLINVFKKKEKKFWGRTIGMKQKMGWFGFIFGLLIVSIAHYGFAIMHFLMESLMWLGGNFNADMKATFQENLKKLNAKAL